MSFWDNRYKDDEFSYGAHPNDFLKEQFDKIKPQGNVMSLGEGEGRNAIYLATQGFKVDSVDLSSVGVGKLLKWAETEGLQINAQVGDLQTFEFKKQYDAFISIWCHLPPDLMDLVSKKVNESLQKGGILILEAYTPANCGRNTGGPPDPAMCLTKELILKYFPSLEPIVLVEKEREVHEGKFHNGQSAVVQFVGRKL